MKAAVQGRSQCGSDRTRMLHQFKEKQRLKRNERRIIAGDERHGPDTYGLGLFLNNGKL